MDLHPRDFLNVLYKYIEEEDSGAKQCEQLLTKFSDTLTQEQMTSTYFDLYLQHLFNRLHGLHNILSKIINKKLFKSSIVKIFEIIYTFVNNFPLVLQKYLDIIYDACFKVIKSRLVSADEKVKSLEVVILTFEKNLYHPDSQIYMEVYNNLMASIALKKCDSVEEKMLIALGAFAKHYQCFVSNSEHLKVVFLNGLETQMAQKNLSNKIICGLFTGLDQFCNSFPFDASSKEDLLIINKLYKYIEKMSVPSGIIKVANRAALTFLANHICLFINNMVDKYKFWHETLLKWLEFGSEDQKMGVLVLEAYFLGLGKFLLSDVCCRYKHVIKYFTEYFQKNLKTDNKIPNNVRKLCLYGFASFSAVFQLHCEEEERKRMLVLITCNFEQTYILNQDPPVDALDILALYLQTVAKFVHFRPITNNELFCLQKGAILLIKDYPKLSYSSHAAVTEALILTFYYLSINDEAMFDTFIDNVIFQGVLWTTSHQHVSEAELSEMSSEPVVTVKSYLTLWIDLLKIIPVRKYDKFGVFLQDRKYILIKIIDKLIRTMLILINKLNVSIIPSENTEAVTDIQSAYRVEAINDFAIFLNLVDFYEKVFQHIDPSTLKTCVCKLIYHLIEKCEKYPLVSGFYKLLSFCLKNCKRIDFFQKSTVESSEDVKLCYLTLSRYLNVLLNQTQQHTGDLLISCLQVIIEYPVMIIEKILSACVSSFKAFFNVGRTYIKLAHLALDTLEYWQNTIANEHFEPFLIQIIPLLDCYLQSKSLDSIKTSANQNKRKSAQALKKRKVIVDIEPELHRLQLRIIQFIGQQKSTLCQAFVFSNSRADLSVWANNQHLKVDLHYEDLKIHLYLEKFLPRVVHIALESTDRKTRIAACEFLHSIVMIFLGSTKQMSLSGLSDLNELLRHISIPLLRLGCDMDPVVEQLFQPLCFQLIHWYTHPLQLRREHSAIIIESIVESVSHPTDTALRDFSGKCVHEFVKWTIKQSSDRDLSNDPINIKILLNKMRFYSMHPDPFKKLGAALIFNNIYTQIREETSLLSIFWIEVLYIFVKSLSSLENYIIDQNLSTQINSTLNHLQRGFMLKSELFNNVDTQRRIPSDLKGGCLKDVAVWLLEQTGSKNDECRKKCMELFCSISAKSQSFTNHQNFIQINFTNNWVQEIYESQLIQYPTLDCLNISKEVTPIIWIEALLCALDGHNFIIKNKLLKTTTLTETTETSIRYFLEKMSTITSDGSGVIINSKNWQFTTQEKQHFDKQRSQAILKILQFLSISGNSQFYTSDLWNLLVKLIFERQTLGFECILPQDDIDKEILLLLQNFVMILPDKAACQLVNTISEYLSKNISNEFDLKGHVTFKQRNAMKGINMMMQIIVFKELLMKFTNGMTATLLNNFLRNNDEVIYLDDLKYTTWSYCVSVLTYALENESELKIFVEYLYQDKLIQTVNCKQPICFGSYLLTVFEETLINKIFTNFDLFFTLCLEKCKMDKSVDFIARILAYSNAKKQFNEYVVLTLLTKWDVFEKHFSVSLTNIQAGLSFVKNLIPIIKIHKLQCEQLKIGLIHLLEYDKDSLWKDEFEFKIEIIYLLADIMDTSEDENDNLRCGLECLKIQLITESSLISGETKAITIDKLLRVTSKIRNHELFFFVLLVYAKIATENTDIKSYLIDSILYNKEIETQRLLLNKIYNMDLYENLDIFQQYKLIINISVLFQYCDNQVLEDFFNENSSEIISVLKNTVTGENLPGKILNFLLVEIFYLRCNNSDKSLLLQLLKFTLEAIKCSFNCNPELEELLRLYKCHSYNTMISIVSNSLKDINFYTKLFVRQNDNKDILWSSLIDTKRTYTLQTDFDDIPKQKKILINIRDQTRRQKKSHESQYLESLRLINSSLSEDVTKFDFTNSVLRSEINEDSTDSVAIQGEVELDSTDINAHECMANVCGLIEHMFRTGISEFPTDDDNNYEVPAWIKAIRMLLLNEDTSINVKLFWVKAIDNTVHIFKHFAKYFTEPLLKFIVDRCAGSSFNYFVNDVVAILAAWSTDFKPTTHSEIQLASAVVNFLIDNITNERQDIFKYHIYLVRVLVEAWKESIEFPYDLISSKLRVDPTSKPVEIGVHLSSIFLANKILPDKEHRTEFCKSLFNIVMKNTYKIIYKPCAEAIGLFLVSTRNESSKLEGNVLTLLEKIIDHDKHALVLEGITLHYPNLIKDNHLNMLLNRIHGVTKSLKIIYLRIILNHCDNISKLDDFKNENWDSYIGNDHLEVQLLALEIVFKSLDTLRYSSTFRSIVESICKLMSNLNVLCRTKMFDILILIYHMENIPLEIKNLCKSVLIQGLCDEDSEIRKRVYDFWKINSCLPQYITGRFSYILSNLYEINTENDFLGYCCYFLLDPPKSGEEYNKLLFEHPLEDCDFETYYLETNSRTHHLSVVPLFAETVRSTSLRLPTFDSDFKLRQTQTLMDFEPTQSVRSKQFSQFTMAESSLYIKPVEDEFVNPNVVELSHKYRIPKRRFLRDKSKIQRSFAHKEVEKKVKQVEHRKKFASKCESNFTIYRNYRKGDLPDVQITLQAVIEPLQALALLDGEISKILYLEISRSILEKSKSDVEFIQEISIGIQTIFKNSTEFNRNLFRTLFDVLISSKSVITFPPELIVTVSQCSALRTLGVLLLEEYLISYGGTEIEAKKSRGTQMDQDTKLWIKLAELYKEMEEWDVVKSIFLEKNNCSSQVRNALVAESQKQWKDAQDLYQQLITTDEVTEIKDFYYDSYFKCFAHLGEWANLVESIDSTVSTSNSDSWNNLWDQGFNQRQLLPWYINGHLKTVLFNNSCPSGLFSNLNNILECKHLVYLETHFLEEMVMFWIFNGEIDEAERYLKTYITNFLNDWQQIESSYTNLRYNKLLKVRNIVDINQFVSVFKNLSADNTSLLENLIKYWNRTAFENLPTILLSEEKVLYRKQFLRTLIKKVESFGEDFKNLLTSLNDVNTKLDDRIIETAIEDNNFYMTKKYLCFFNKSNVCKLKFILSKLAYIKSSMLYDPEKKIEVILKGVGSLTSVFEDSDDKFLLLSAHITYFKQMKFISSLVSPNPELFEKCKSDMPELLQITCAEDIALYAADKLKCFLYNSNLEESINSDENVEERKTVANAYVELAYFFQEKNCFSNFLLFVLKAIKFNSDEGKQLFPCILMEEEFSQEDKDLFIAEIENIPVWMFLDWIPQILVNIDSSKVSIIKPLVLKIAKTYPQSIMYAYRLSKENYKYQNPEAKELIASLDEILFNDARIDKFLKALSFVAIPSTVLMYYIRKMMKLVLTDNLEEVKSICDFILKEIFNNKADSRDVTLMQGNMFKKIAKFEKEFKNMKDLLNKSGNASNVLKHLRKINTDVEKILQDDNEKKRNSRLLKDYSPWLANFSVAKNNFELEIPGQYDGKRLPLSQYHVKISGFSPNVAIMSSLRKPIKITLLGTDTKEYSFLIKFGEDVRQDQRIQQVFSLMNNILAHDKNLNGYEFHILTYQVIPLTTSLGLIQWIGNTNSLQEFVEASTDKKSLKQNAQIFETYRKWIYTPMNQAAVDAYGKSAMKYSRDKTIIKFKALTSVIEWDVFRKTFLKLSNNTESFFILRNNFIKSYAVMCVSHWLLGVGDRHLSNSLICLNTGKVLGIDFGHAFGTATQILPVPELVPFRLTPHIVNLMEPLGERGLFREIMIHSLRSLRSNSDSLISTMKVFIEEPSLDWLEHASRFSKSAEKNEWYPSQKIKQARRKLCGANPVSIMTEDLIAGHQKNELYLKAYVDLVKGVPEHNLRAKMAEDDLSVEEQVDCLIDHATDYNLLGRMFEGWSAWV